MADEKLPPHIASPLGPFKGDKPPAPAWFDKAVAAEPERTRVPAAGAEIELLTWGERGKPGLLLVHGASAHADWWSFIAPFFAEHYRVAAMSMSGMGGSDWRERYAFELFADEMHACAEAAGLHDNGHKPIYIGHSFGGAAVYYASVANPQRMRATILVDSGFGRRPKPEDSEASDDVQPPPENRASRIYPTFEAALARFRFMPPQPADNLFIVDWIARHSLREVDDGQGGKGWTWRFDPMLFPRLDRSGVMQLVGKKPGVPVTHIFGDRSNVIARSGGRPDILGPEVAKIVIPDSDHHVMVDQPLALVAALRSVLALWP